MIINAPAKINIGLRILGKRDDGFHNLESVFYPIDFSDKLQIDISPSRKNTNSVYLSSNNPVLPNNENNICYKAVINFFRVFRINRNYQIKIFLEKNIPIGSGLGGGSSNAAAVIKYLTKYFNIDIKENKKELLKIAEQCGSDVPFFMISKPCYVSGKGNELRILPEFILDYKILLVNSGVHVSTKWAYEHLKMSPGVSKDRILDKFFKFHEADKDNYQNDFEKVVFEKYPVLNNIKNRLYENGAVFASLSGSGGTIYGLFNKEVSEIQKCESELLDSGYKVNIV